MIEKFFSLGVIFLLLASTFSGSIPYATQASSNEEILFFEDFERYAAGVFPSAGGWILVWDGKGAKYQIVADAFWYSLKKSLRLWGSYGWSCVVEKHFSTTANVIGFEACVLIEDYPLNGNSAKISFWNREKATWGKGYATVVFTKDGYIYATSPMETKNLQPYVPKRWYKVRLVLDRSTDTFSVWINDELKTSDLKTKDTYEIDALKLESGWGGVQCYYDDVRVFTGEATTGELTVKVHNVSGKPLPSIGGIVTVCLWRGNYEEYLGEESESFNGGENYVSVTFPDLNLGHYTYEVYQKPNGGLRIVEFWGSGSAEVRAGETNYADFYRHTSWITDVKINGKSLSEVTVRPKDKVYTYVIVKNEERESIQVKVRVIFDRDKRSPYDYDRTSGSFLIGPKKTSHCGLPDYSPINSGVYYVYVVVYSLYSDWVVTDQWNWVKAFSVEKQISQTSLALRSCSTDGRYSNFDITFNGVRYDTPIDLKVELGEHNVKAEYPGGQLACYDFHHWEWDGDVKIDLPYSRETNITIEGDGILTAMYGVRVYVDIEGKGSITFNDRTYTSPNYADPPVLVGEYLIKATPSDGYVFAGWETRDYLSVEKPDSSETYVKVNGYGVLKAVFEPRKMELNVIDASTDKSSYTTDETITFKFTVKNNGNVKVTFRPVIKFATPTGSVDVLTGGINPEIASLEPGVTQTFTSQKLAEIWYEQWGAGKYQWGVLLVDAETSKVKYTDTCYIREFRIEKPLPDLTVTSVKAHPSKVRIGDTLTVEFTEKNQENVDSGEFTTRVYLAKTKYGTDYVIGDTGVHSLKAGESKHFKFDLPIPAAISPGEYYVTISIDCFKRVKESNENNNIESMSSSITVKARTFLVLDPLPSEVEECSEITFTGRLLMEHNRLGIEGATIKIYDSDALEIGGVTGDDPIAEGKTNFEGYFAIKWYAFPTDPAFLTEDLTLEEDLTIEVYAKFEGTDYLEPSVSPEDPYKINIIRILPPSQIPEPPQPPDGTVQLLPPYSHNCIKEFESGPLSEAVSAGTSSGNWGYLSLASTAWAGKAATIGMMVHSEKFTPEISGEYEIIIHYEVRGVATFAGANPGPLASIIVAPFQGITLANILTTATKEVLEWSVTTLLEEAGMFKTSGIKVALWYYFGDGSGKPRWVNVYSKTNYPGIFEWRAESFKWRKPIVLSKVYLEKGKTYCFVTGLTAITTSVSFLTTCSASMVSVYGFPTAVFIRPTTGRVDVQPKTWSIEFETGKSKSQAFTVSALGGIVKGVTVAKLSGPDWITINPTSLGDISADSSKTFTVTISPPTDVKGSFDYLIRVSCVGGEPVDITGTIMIKSPPPDTESPRVAEIEVEPGKEIYDNYPGDIRFRVYWMDNEGIAKVVFYWNSDGVSTPTGSDVDADGIGWYWFDLPRFEWLTYVGEEIRLRSITWDFAGNEGSTLAYEVRIKDDDATGPKITDVTISEHRGDGDGNIEEGEEAKISWRLSDPSGIHETSFMLDGEEYVITKPFMLEGAYYVITKPLSAGEHTFQITAMDNDNDRPNDRASSKHSATFTVIHLPSNPWRYDFNKNGVIERNEAVEAVKDYFGGKIGREQVLEVVKLYFG